MSLGQKVRPDLRPYFKGWWDMKESENYPEVCPRADGLPDCENCPDWNGWTCTYPKGD
ncbi:unnamed protein product [marine sediment metagenome]|uniref:Uncharacterized protein n=1 Tax=marine sediment metagenome TaxID=412755 RepID=X1JVQ3_9ZZZZ